MTKYIDVDDPKFIQHLGDALARVWWIGFGLGMVYGLVIMILIIMVLR